MRVFALHVVAQCSKILLKGIFKASHLDTIRNHMKQEHEDTGTEIYQDVRVNPGRVKLRQITFYEKISCVKGDYSLSRLLLISDRLAAKNTFY